MTRAAGHRPGDYGGVLQSAQVGLLVDARGILTTPVRSDGENLSPDARHFSWKRCGQPKKWCNIRRCQNQSILARIRDPAGPPNKHVTEQAAFQGCSRHNAQLGQPLGKFSDRSVAAICHHARQSLCWQLHKDIGQEPPLLRVAALYIDQQLLIGESRQDLV
jgi:hypothetical protein